MTTNEAWRSFKGTHWTEDVNVRDFIQKNYTPYGNGSRVFDHGLSARVH